jgi:hypothetical protein
MHFLLYEKRFSSHLRCPGNIGLLAVLSKYSFLQKPKPNMLNWDPQQNNPELLFHGFSAILFLTRNMVFGLWNDPINLKHKTFFTALIKKS